MNSLQALFNNAANKHKGDFESLMGLRRFFPEDNVANFDNVLAKVCHYQHPTTLLFYDHDGERLIEC